MTRILHLTPHLGGGVGRVLLNYMAYDNGRAGREHHIACLDYANEPAQRRGARLGIPITDELAGQLPELFAQIREADVTLIHWWNHPLLWDLLVNQPLPAARVLLWSHIAGHTAPQIFTDELVAYPDHFVLATEFSRESAVIQALPEAVQQRQLRTVFTCAGFDHVKDVRPEPHEGFRVGYIGTVDYIKMHRDFLAMSAAARIDDVTFVVCGGDQHGEIRAEAERLGLGGKFEILGPVADIRPYLATFDLFGYPLCRDHYGTGEQVIMEAMACGVPPVVLGPGAEAYVVTDGVDGVVTTEADYPRALERLHRDPALRARLSAGARERARSHYTIEHTADAWATVFDEVLASPKRARSWPGLGPSEAGGLSRAAVFVTSLGDQAEPFATALGGDPPAVERAEAQIARLPYIHRTPTRGTARHYRFFFEEDATLERWDELLSSPAGED